MVAFSHSWLQVMPRPGEAPPTSGQMLLLAGLQAVFVPVLIALCIAGMSAPFRRWFLRSRRWWLVPAGVLLAGLIPTGMCMLMGYPYAGSPLVPVVKAGVGFCLLFGLVPRRDVEVEGSDWREGVFWLWIPTLLVGAVAGMASLRLPIVPWAGVVSPLSVIALAYVLLLARRLDRLAWPRPRVGIALGVSLLFLWPWGPLWSDMYGRTDHTLARLGGWAVGLPALLETVRNPELIQGLGPFGTYGDFVKTVSQLTSMAARSFLTTSAVGGFTVAGLLPFLMMAGLGLGVRRRGVRVGLVLLALPLLYLCVVCNTHSYAIGVFTTQGLPLPVAWRVPLGKAVCVTAMLGLLTVAVPAHRFRLEPLPPGVRRMAAWGLLYVIASSAVCLALAISLSLSVRGVPVATATEKTPSTLALRALLDDRFSRSDPASTKASNELEAVVAGYNASPGTSVGEMTARWSPQLAALRELARFESAPDLGKTVQGGPPMWTADLVIQLQARPIRDLLASPVPTPYSTLAPPPPRSAPLTPADLERALDSTSTTLHAVVALQTVAPSGSWERIRSCEAALTNLTLLVDRLGSTTDTAVRRHFLEPAMAMTQLTQNDFLRTGDETVLWAMTGSHGFERWPARVVVGDTFNPLYGGGWAYPAFCQDLFRYHWARAQLKVLIFRERTGRFPASWDEVEGLLGRDPTDGILGVLDARFATFLTFRLGPGDQVTLSWSIPAGRPPLTVLYGAVWQRMSGLVVLRGVSWKEEPGKEAKE